VQAHYPESFEREVGCTPAEWLMWLPDAVGPRLLVPEGANSACVAIGEGQLALAWQVLPPRAIASMRMPRLAVSFRFERVGEDERQRFMRRFDLYMQRGGG
jgi:hypothetical protein